MKINEVQNIYINHLRNLTGIFKKYNIIPMGGTALGCVRHKGFIPWDDDLDFFIRPKYFKKMLSSNELIVLEPFTNFNSLGFAKIVLPTHVSNEKYLKKETHSFCSIDLMIMCEARTKFDAILKFYLLKLIALIGVFDRRFDFNLLVSPLKYLGKYFLYKEVKNPKYIFHATGKADLKKGLYNFDYFHIKNEINFEDLKLLNYTGINQYLKVRYGSSFMNLPTEAVKNKYKSHTSGFNQFSDITFLIDGVGVYWEKSNFENNGQLSINKKVNKFLSILNNKVIICTNIPNRLNNSKFEIFTTEKKHSKLSEKYFKKLINKFNLNVKKVIYVEHSKKVCKFASKYFEIVNWDESINNIDLLINNLLKTINKINFQNE